MPGTLLIATLYHAQQKNRPSGVERGCVFTEGNSIDFDSESVAVRLAFV
jgi:hypothetical protein